MIVEIPPVRRHHGQGRRAMWLMSAAAAVCVLAPGVQAASSEQLRETFRQLDANADGQVSATEFENKKIYVFSVHDANEDNAVQPNEVDLDARQFQTIDTDGDGQISGFEFIEAPIGQFQAYDADRNGSMTFDELAASARQSATSP